ncbi:MAG: PAS domain S-box protein [Actinobacteria bacterium]|jgi:PAS domain S-box-containing protein|nr:MAG: PAS domain S-box protein [Actinomycetota bacterium]
MGTDGPNVSDMDKLKPGDHVCILFKDGDERRSAFTRVVLPGLKGNEKVVYIRGDADADGSGAGVYGSRGDENAAATAGVLTFSADQTCVRGGSFDPDDMLAWIEEQADAALSQGYDAFRLITDAGWALRDVAGADRLIEFEHKLNRFSRRDCTFACLYDMGRFHPMILLGVLNAHPKIIYGAELLDNYYHVEEEDFAVEDYPRIALEKYLGSLQAFHAHIRAVLGFGAAAGCASSDALLEQAIPASALEGYYSRSLALLSRAASRFVEARLEDDLWRMIGEELERIVGESFIIVSSFDECTGEASLRAVMGDQDVISEAAAMIGRDPLSITLGVTEDVKRISLRGELAHFGGGLAEISAPLISSHVWEEWRESFDLGDVFGISFTNRGELLGGAVIVTLKGTAYPNKLLIEAFARIAAIAIQRRRAESGLEESEQRFRTLVHSAHDAIATCDSEGLIISWNEGAREMFGYGEEEILGESILTLMPDDRRGEYVARLTEGISAGDPFLVNKIVVGYGKRKDGGVFPLEISTSAWEGEEGRCYTGVIRDITERKSLEEALLESEWRYRELFENTGEGIAVVDEDERILFANPTGHDIFGVEQGVLAGRSLRDLTDDRGFSLLREQTIRRKKGEKSRYEVDIIRADGKRRTILVTSTPRFDKEGCFIGSFGVFSDITERKMMDKELEAFAHTVSHDLRGLLAVVEGFNLTAIDALEGGDGERGMRCLSSAVDATRRANVYIASLLDYATARQPEGRITHVDAEEVLLEVFNDLEQDILEKGVEITVIGNLPSVEVSPVKMRQVFLNLIGNAIKYMGGNPEPRIEVGVTGEGKEAAIYVRDNGIGIPADKLEDVFLPFERLGEEKTDGLGIGLATVRRAVEAWGGKVWAESAPGEGAAFYFTLPAAD